jgi:hypothetical protein
VRRLLGLELHPAQGRVRRRNHRDVALLDLGEHAQAVQLDFLVGELVVAQREEFLDLGEVEDAGLGELALGALGVERLVVDLAPEARPVLGRVGHVEVLAQLGEVVQVGLRELAVRDRLLHLVAVLGLLLVATEPVLDAHSSVSVQRIRAASNSPTISAVPSDFDLNLRIVFPTVRSMRSPSP